MKQQFAEVFGRHGATLVSASTLVRIVNPPPRAVRALGSLGRGWDPREEKHGDESRHLPQAGVCCCGHEFPGYKPLAAYKA